MTQKRIVKIGHSTGAGGDNPLLLIAGPCQIESEAHCLKIAETLVKLCQGREIGLVFKSSYDKANRTSAAGKRGPGIDEGLRVLEKVKKELGVPVLTDIHSPEQAAVAAEVADVLQTPAFLCRQTDLLAAAGATGKAVNVKKGQFLHPADMQHVAQKIAGGGNHNIMLCERGTCFGYRDLVVDMRGLKIMSESGYPVIFDATHSVQQMGGEAGKSGGMREFIRPLIRAAVATGVAGIFVECHDDPDKAPSDGASMLNIKDMPEVIEMALAIHAQVRKYV